MVKRNRVGLGTFPLANVFSKVSRDEAKDIVRLFLRDGGYYIDTAPLYGSGEVEKLLGEVLVEFKREDYYLITKCAYVLDEKTGEIKKSSKYKDIIEECDRSLKRLKVDYFDLYIEHSPDPDAPPSEVMRAFSKLKKDGKVKEVGVSNVSLDELKEYCKYGVINNVQNRFSLINRSVDECFIDYLLEKKYKFDTIPSHRERYVDA